MKMVSRSRQMTVAFLIGAVLQGVSANALEYPKTQRTDDVDLYHGVEDRDLYRWLEEDVRESQRVRDWVEAQNKVTFGYLKSLPG